MTTDSIAGRGPDDGRRVADDDTSDPSVTTPLVGVLFADKYTITGFVGAGGMARVFRAMPADGGDELALKLLRRQSAAAERVRKRFLREAELISQFRHPNIVRFLDYGEAEGHCYIAMELLKGLPLSELLAHGPLRPDFALEVVEQAARALEEPHGVDVVHRDIKPSNIFLLRDENNNLQVKLLDFGVAHVAPVHIDPEDEKADPDTAEMLTKLGSVIGTPSYMAPEQIRGLPVSAAADVYALGSVLYQAITGSLPFTGPSAFAVLVAKVHGKLEPPSQRVDSFVPPELDEVIVQLLQADPGLRPQRAHDVSTLLGALRRTLQWPEALVLPAGPLELALVRAAKEEPIPEELLKPPSQSARQEPARERILSWVQVTGAHEWQAQPREPTIGDGSPQSPEPIPDWLKKSRPHLKELSHVGINAGRRARWIYRAMGFIIALLLLLTATLFILE